MKSKHLGTEQQRFTLTGLGWAYLHRRQLEQNEKNRERAERLGKVIAKREGNAQCS